MSDDIRLKLAKVLHEAWCVEPFDANKYPEDFAMADAVLKAFPWILNPPHPHSLLMSRLSVEAQ